jgi:glycosyltransferase involved in cell wall biosynthesis
MRANLNGRRARILLASPSRGEYGGIEAFVICLAEFLAARADFEVRACFKLVSGCSVSDNLRDELARSGISYAVVPRASRELVRQLRWADLVHGQNASPDICALSRVLGKKLVLTIHNHMHGRRGARVFLWKRAMRLADRRWYNSRFVRRSWETESSVAFPTVPRIERRFSPLDNRVGFVFVSRMIPNKGADTLLEAYVAANLDPVRWPLRMVGAGPLLDGLKGHFESHRGIHFDGFVTQQRKDEVIAGAKWMVTPPSGLEDMGLTPIEARSKGIPCIVSLDGGLPEVAGEEAITCRPGDADDLARCLGTAARMSADEYAARAAAAYEGLGRLLRPLDWYAESYHAVLRG